MKWRSLLFALFVLAAIPAVAARPSDQQLIADSDVIVVGRVTAVETVKLENGDLATRATVAIEQVLSGSIGPRHELQITSAGGVLGDRALHVANQASFAKGERAMFFLQRSGERWRMANGAFGKIAIDDASGIASDITGHQRNAARFVNYVRSEARGFRRLADYELHLASAGQHPPLKRQPDVVPSSYVRKSTRISGDGGFANGLDGYGYRWQTFGAALVFETRGSQIGATNGGLDALQAAVNAWTNNSSSQIPISIGGSVGVGAGSAADAHHTVQFEDPDDDIPGSYGKPSFAATTGNLPAAREQHAAAYLTTYGGKKVLLAGGLVSNAVTNSAVLYDATANTFTALAGTTGHMTVPRKDFQILMYDPDASATTPPIFLIPGGFDGTNYKTTIDYFDSFNDTFGDAGFSLQQARSQYGAVSLGPSFTGTIALFGGYNGTASLDSCEILDDSVPSSTLLSAHMNARRRLPAVAMGVGGDVLGIDGVLIAGGLDGTTALSSAEIFHASTSTFSATGSMSIARSQATATLLTTGHILITGGVDGSGNAVNVAEVYDVNKGEFIRVGDMNVARYGHTATRMSDGRVLIAGGTDGSTTFSSAEFYDPDTHVFTLLTRAMATPRAFHTATVLDDPKKILLAGGNDGSNTLDSAELFNLPSSFPPGIVKVWSTPGATHVFGGVTFQTIIDADIILQDGLPAACFSNGGFEQLLANLLGQALGFDTPDVNGILNSSFDIETPLYGAQLASYDQTVAGFVYPACPSIGTAPQSQTIRSGLTASLSVSASGGGDLTYQWYQVANGGDIAVGSNQASYTTPALTQTKQYYVRITNDCGTPSTSATATITVAPRGDATGDGTLTDADVDALMSYYYAAGASPTGDPDVDANGTADIGDIFYLINYLHGQGAAPPQ